MKARTNKKHAHMPVFFSAWFLTIDRHGLKLFFGNGFYYCRAKIEPAEMEKWATYDLDPEVTLENMKTEVPFDDDEFDYNIDIRQLYGEVGIKSENDKSVNFTHDVVVVHSVPQEQILKEEDDILYGNEEKGLLNCYHCNYSADHRISLIDHMKSHMNEKHAHMYSENENIIKHPNSVTSKSSRQLRCEGCDATFNRKSNLDRHTLRKHPQFISSVTSKIHECKICTYKAITKFQFDSHMRKHSGEEPPNKFRSCIHCNARFASKRAMDNHVLRKHPKFIETLTNKIHECKICTYKAITKFQFDKHMRKHSGEKPPTKFISCIHCDARFSSKKNLDDHVLRKHPKFIETVTSKIHECKFCIYKTTVKSGFIKHMLKHGRTNSSYKFNNCNFSEGLLSCYHCNYSADHKASLIAHMKVHTNEEHAHMDPENENIIDQPNSVTTKSSTINDKLFSKHRRSVTSKQLSCEGCDATFTSKHGLDQHTLKKHPQFISSVTSKIYGCKICAYKTITKRLFDNHMRKHSGEKPPDKLRGCIHCNARFASKRTMDDHVLRKHPKFIETVTSKIYECKFCIYKTTANSGFKKHMRKHGRTNSKFNNCNFSEGLLSCYHCNYSTDRKRSLIDHIKVHTNEKHAHMDSENENIINQPNSVTTKSSTINDDKPFSKHRSKQLRCEACDATFTSKHNLDRHTLKKHPQFISSVTSKIYGCKICTYKTTTKSQFDTHMRKHSGEPSPEIRSCVYCNAILSSKKSMDEHLLRKHPKSIETVTSKIHECKFCIYKTTNKVYFKRHMLNHPETMSSYKFNNCDVCEAKFVKKESLYDHILREHPEFTSLIKSQIYQCQLCSYKTTLKYNLDGRHINKKCISVHSAIQCSEVEKQLMHIYVRQTSGTYHINYSTIYSWLQAKPWNLKLSTNKYCDDYEKSDLVVDVDCHTFESRETAETFEELSIKNDIEIDEDTSIKFEREKQWDQGDLVTKDQIEEIKSEICMEEDLEAMQPQPEVAFNNENDRRVTTISNIVLNRIKIKQEEDWTDCYEYKVDLTKVWLETSDVKTELEKNSSLTNMDKCERLDRFCRTAFDKKIFNCSTINNELAQMGKLDNYNLTSVAYIKRNEFDLDSKQLHEEIEIKREDRRNLRPRWYRVVNSTMKEKTKESNNIDSEIATNECTDEKEQTRGTNMIKWKKLKISLYPLV
ncbi:unnamed protein product [Callosobruchus maculatus]|uniref:C2H2-type domain-containing protein n=1 Tax=Callosobruchus maculatus TaxID=64391 RepID=A0A653BU08_CALMS|nr:unnamed protein product [Callosobruchus maculatus]